MNLLREHDASLWLSDHHDAPAPWIVTAHHVYLRGHGPGGRYKDNYSEPTLRDWAKHIRKWRRQGNTVFAYFNNDQKSAAPADAQRLMRILGLKTGAGTHGAPANNRARQKFMASSRP